MQTVNDTPPDAMGPSDSTLSPLWLAEGPPVHATIDGARFPFVTPVRNEWAHLLLPVRRSHWAHLDIEQAHVVLSHLLPFAATVGLGFWTEPAGSSRSAFTRGVSVYDCAAQDGTAHEVGAVNDGAVSDGAVQVRDGDVVTVRNDRYLVSTFRGTGADLLMRLDDGAGGFEWPGLIWSPDRAWVVDSGPGRAFSLLSAPPATCAAIAADPRSGDIVYVTP